MKLIKILIATLGFIYALSAQAGFYIANGVLYEGNGHAFKMRGINHAHTWFTYQLDHALDGIAATGANTVRVVLSNGHRWNKNNADDVANVIQQAKKRHLIAVLEVHDTTGFGEEGSAASLDSAAGYWIEMKDKLVGQEDYVIINLGNEPIGNNVDSSVWINGTMNAIKRLRDAGFTHTLMVDAPNWGQDWKQIMLNNAQFVFNADPLRNTIFSVHMYQVYGDYNAVNNYITSFLNKGLALLVGEFGAGHQGSEVAEDAIMERAETLNLGYIGWSWSGNSSENAELDIVNNWDNNSFSPWGNTLVNGVNGIRATSTPATIFTCGYQCN
ncbi:glycoside hydrolase family 5 protein [Vibrio mangrovi]|uniref:Glycoside hydrolase family 5 protein n=1 Tax=Vibrio mangrovi TaxID=474394 RepID=A0A1Y6IX64_9VIBR|nr:glycoside hydrolase family 5 protein [Vibrio mangrovi]MDW6002755.1 glycoside hydrolase family 5 protein [Vibrio mangrovi]SMS02247.1 Mannan endo-1,4-beta-mannosidase precursor [Vibrio mangrovi]